MWIECRTEKQRKIAKNGLIKNCDLGDCKITLSVRKGCKDKSKSSLIKAVIESDFRTATLFSKSFQNKNGREFIIMNVIFIIIIIFIIGAIVFLGLVLGNDNLDAGKKYDSEKRQREQLEKKNIIRL